MAEIVEFQGTICDGGTSMVAGGHDGGLLLPIGGNWEREIGGVPLQALLVFAGLAYCFAGVASIADVFMGAIEKITSKRVRVEDPKTRKKRTVYVWNPTVANLTLMALGSSAPEILLSVIELISNSMQSGELGPSTIVGSAAFNLLVIIAVCVSCIPSGESRAIKELPVFFITGVFSVFAYVWLLIILLVSSPHVIEVWEGVLTFAFFPVLCILAYLADIGVFHKLFKMPWEGNERQLVLTSDTTEEDRKLMVLEIISKYGKGPNVEEVMEDLLHFEFDPKPSRCALRIEGTRQMFGSIKKAAGQYSQLNKTATAETRKSLINSKPVPPASFVDFQIGHYVVKEAAGKVECIVQRTGDLSQACRVHCRTQDGTATSGSDFEVVDGDFTFAPGQTTLKIPIVIKEDGATEDTEQFSIELMVPSDQDPLLAQLGKRSQAVITIIDSDTPGVLSFKSEDLTVQDALEMQTVTIDVERKSGTTGTISCTYRTEQDTAVEGYDYEAINGTLTFENGQAAQSLQVKILPNHRGEATEQFRVVLENISGGAKFDAHADGNEERSTCTITIAGDPTNRSLFTPSALGSMFSDHQLLQGQESWKGQLTEALAVDGDAGIAGRACHFILLPWKLLCAMVPPPGIMGGWASFFVALAVIGALTAVIGDLADMLGCALSMEPSITAITLVAVGTSLPDTFASKTAAVEEDTADNSVGNVTGSNSVNVFLGLGLPWAVGALYWKMKGVNIDNPKDPWMRHAKDTWLHELGSQGQYIVDNYPATFVVPAGSLGVSVAAFSSCAITCLLTLVVRRQVLGAELGGPDTPKHVTSAFFLLLWVIYITVSILSA